MTLSLPHVGARAVPAGAPAGPLRAAWQGAESLCIRCGFCLPACPTYRLTGMETASPRGRLDLMYAAAQGRLTVEDIEPALALCLGCLACQTACPSGIAYGDMLEAERIESARRRRSSLPVRFLLGKLLDSPTLLRLVVWALHAYQVLGLQRLVRIARVLDLLAPRLARLERALPPVPRPFPWRRRAGVGEAAVATPGTRETAALLTGCVMEAAFGAVHLATVQALRRNGVAVTLPPGQGCCGALQHHAGDEREAQALARRNIAAFEAAGEGPIVVNSAGCGAMMKSYGALLDGDEAWRQRAARFSARVVDVSELLARRPLAPPAHALRLRVAYDDPCHLLHAQKVREPPRAMLRAIPGLELVELPEADWCCGSAGSFSLAQPEMARRVLERKMEHIARLGVDVVATGNPGCLLQIALGARERGLKLRVVHPVELLARAYEEGDEPA